MPMNRRAFLGQMGAGAALAAFSPAASMAAPLRRKQLVRPGDPEYDAAREEYNGRIDVFPSALYFAESPKEVQLAVRLARATHTPFRARSGRHSYEGYSVVQRGWVIDVSALKAIEVNERRGTARVGAGVNLLELYERLWESGLTLSAGSCPGVGIAGLALGGGYGLLARSRGLTCDNLLEVQLVTADGRLLRADEFHYPELFWAMRGGGGGNFGIATSFVFRVEPIGNVAIYNASWSLGDLPEVLGAWQSWAPMADPRLVSVLTLPQASVGQVWSAGQFVGSAAELKAELSPLLSAGALRNVTIQEMPFIDAVRLFGGVASEDKKMALSLSSQHARFKSTSAYAFSPFDDQAIATLIRQLQEAPGPNNLIQLDAHGGEIAALAPSDTAYVHRRALFSLQYQSYWNDDAVADANIQWTNGVRAAMSPHTSGAYVNYIDSAIADWPSAYYGDNLRALQRVKARYDAENIFRFPQSIPLP